MRRSDQHIEDVLEFTLRRLDQLDDAIAGAREAVASFRATAESSRARRAQIEERSALTEALARAGALTGISPIAGGVTTGPTSGSELARKYELRVFDDPHGERRETQQESGYGS